jgi:hypothetical protein
VAGTLIYSISGKPEIDPAAEHVSSKNLLPETQELIQEPKPSEASVFSASHPEGGLITINRPVNSHTEADESASSAQERSGNEHNKNVTENGNRVIPDTYPALTQVTEAQSYTDNSKHKQAMRAVNTQDSEVPDDLSIRPRAPIASYAYAEEQEDRFTSSARVLPSHPKQQSNYLYVRMGAEYQYLLLHRSLTAQNTSFQDYANFRNTYENPQNQTTFGISIQLEKNRWLLNSGILHTTFSEDINYPTSLLVNTGVDNGQWNVQNIWNYTTDSSWVIDSIFTGYWRIDTNWTLTQDSSWISNWDTVKTEKEMPELAENNGIHTLNYLEIPLWFGRSFGKKRWYLDVQTGLSLGILTGTKGSYYINPELDGLASPEFQTDQFRKYNISGMLRAGVRYRISPQLQTAFYPTIRSTFTNVLNNNDTSQRYWGYGLSVGLVYEFY